MGIQKNKQLRKKIKNPFWKSQKVRKKFADSQMLIFATVLNVFVETPALMSCNHFLNIG